MSSNKDDKEITLIDLDNDIPNILKLDRFPVINKEIEFTPKQYTNAVNMYLTSNTTLKKACEITKISESQFRKLTHNIPELTLYWSSIQKYKAHIYAQELLEIANNEEGDLIETQDQYGNTQVRPNTVKPRRDQMKIQVRTMLMERTCKDYAPKSMTENTNVNVNLSKKLPDGKELDAMNSGDLMDLLRN